MPSGITELLLVPPIANRILRLISHGVMRNMTLVVEMTAARVPVHSMHKGALQGRVRRQL